MVRVWCVAILGDSVALCVMRFVVCVYMCCAVTHAIEAVARRSYGTPYGILLLPHGLCCLILSSLRYLELHAMRPLPGLLFKCGAGKGVIALSAVIARMD